MKTYYIQTWIGETKYIVNYHDGIRKHRDRSDFYDIAIFKNKQKMNNFIKFLKMEGYKQKDY